MKSARNTDPAHILKSLAAETIDTYPNTMTHVYTDGSALTISCPQRRSSIALLDPPFPQCRLCSVSPPKCRHNVAEITRGRAAHTGFIIPVAPQMLRCWGGSLYRAVGRPPCTPRQCVPTRELFLWVDVIFIQVALGSLPLFLPLRDTSFCGLTQERLGG